MVQETAAAAGDGLLHPWGWLPPRRAPLRLPTAARRSSCSTASSINRACWWWVKFRLRRRGLRNLYTINLPPWKDIEALTERLTLKVDELRLAGAGDKVHLVGHSMGGIIARNYLQLRGGAERVDRCVLLAAPNHGSKLAPFALSRLGEALVPGSAFLNRLNAAPLPHPETITAICSRHDNIVLPWQSARLPGARNIELAGMGHVGMLYCPRALAALIDGSCARHSPPSRRRRPNMISLEVVSHRQVEMIDVTAAVRRALRASGVRDGLAVLFVPHTTAAVTINENADPDVVADLVMELNKIVPFADGYRHAEGNSAAHLKSDPGRRQRDPAGRGRRTGPRHLAGDLLLRIRRPAPPHPAPQSHPRMKPAVSPPGPGRLPPRSGRRRPSSACLRRWAAWPPSSARARRSCSSPTCSPARRRRKRSPPTPRSCAR